MPAQSFSKLQLVKIHKLPSSSVSICGVILRGLVTLENICSKGVSRLPYGTSKGKAIVWVRNLFQNSSLSQQPNAPQTFFPLKRLQ